MPRLAQVDCHPSDRSLWGSSGDLQPKRACRDEQSAQCRWTGAPGEPRSAVRLGSCGSILQLNCCVLPFAPPVLLSAATTSGALQAKQASMQQGNHPATPVKTKPRIERNRVLVTGGAGFVGSHLCTFLVERGDHVCSLPVAISLLGGVRT